jgi:outer membrane protein insertion porin family
MNPNFRWTSWTATLNANGEHNRENPIFTSRQALFGIQLQKALNATKTQNLFLRYSLSQLKLTDLLIPELVPESDLSTRLSTVSASYIRDTRNNPLDASKGTYQSVQVDVNPAIFGSSVNFGKVLAQAAYYRELKSGIVWANSLRAGILVPSGRSRIPMSQRFFTGGGSTLRGFPLNGAGPQRSVPACSNPDDTSTCAFIRVPTGGVQMVIFNTEIRLPVPFALPVLKKGLSFVTFYDGGNVYDKVRFRNVPQDFTSSVGIGFRYATPVGPVRVDIGRNLTPVSGINPTQIFITLGQAF